MKGLGSKYCKGYTPKAKGLGQKRLDKSAGVSKARGTKRG